MKHLLSIEDVSREDVERICARAAAFSDNQQREIKKVPALRGRTVLNLFYEASTRTRSSFELAAKRLSADVVNFSAYRPDAIVVRCPWAGAPALVAEWTDAAIINAGDGKHEHPTQALLDIYTLSRRLGSLDGVKIWIVGDVLHSRVARSNILGFQKMGAQVTVAGPPTLLPRDIEAMGVDVRYSLDDLNEADVVYALRMQNERMQQAYLPSMREYASLFQIDERRLGARSLLMHPGPVNRGVELSDEVVDCAQSLILEQVAAGVVVRMAVLFELLAASRAFDPVPEHQSA